MNLILKNENIKAELDRVEDYITQKVCNVVVSIISTEEIDGQKINSSYQIVEQFGYDETWDDEIVLDFILEKLNKRFA